MVPISARGRFLFPKLVKDFQLTEDIYRQSGTVILRPAAALADLAHLAEERKQTAPEIGEITMLSAVQTAKFLPLLKETPSLFISGGGRLDGPAYLNHLQKRAEAKGSLLLTTGALSTTESRVGNCHKFRKKER